MNAASIVSNKYGEVNIYNNFNPYRLRENTEPFMGGLPIVFLTTPSMNIYENGDCCETLLDSNQLFSYLNSTDSYILKQLQYSGGGSTSPFIKLCTNRFKGITLKDFGMKTIEDYENYYGWKQILPASTIDNFTAESSLTVNFAETKNLDITKIFYAWMTYIEVTSYGLHEPTQTTRDNRILDFTSSLYFFLLDFDMRTVLYFTKYTGIYPTNVPLSSLVLSDITSRNAIETTITFAYQYKEELNPQIIYDFNAVSNSTANIFNYTKKESSDGSSDTATASLSSLQSNYGYSTFNVYDPNEDTTVISSSSTSSNSSSSNSYTFSNDGRDFMFEKNYDHVEIKTSSEGSYDTTNSKTAFNSAENSTKRTLVMCFSNNANESGSTGDSKTAATNSNYSTSSWDQLRQNILSNAVETMSELKMGVITSSNTSVYNDYVEKTKKALEIDDDTVNAKKEALKQLYDNGELTEDEYKKELETYETTVEQKSEKILSRSEYSNSSEYKTAVRTANFQKLLETAATTGTSMPATLNEYINQTKQSVYEQASAATETFLKYFGGFL